MKKNKMISGVLCDPVGGLHYGANVLIENGIIVNIERNDECSGPLILPGFVDSHVHIESSMLSPVEFGVAAVRHGTVAVVADPHEVANVAGVEGVKEMMTFAKKSPLKTFFAIPSCVPASPFDECFERFDAEKVGGLLDGDSVVGLGEMMNFPGVINRVPEVMSLIKEANKRGKPIDGHAPGLTGDDLKKYVSANISTDHECFTLKEAEEKIALGMKILIREGSGARNFNALHSLIDSNPDAAMFCTDDCHPDVLETGHINLHVKKALKAGHDIFNVLRVASVNPVKHYNLPVGLLQVGDPADFILVDNLKGFNVLATYIKGVNVLNEKYTFDITSLPEYVFPRSFDSKLLVKKISKQNLKVIGVIENELITETLTHNVSDKFLTSNLQEDILKICVVSRYTQNKSSVALIKGFGLKNGAIACSVAHDSHHIICVGCDDNSMQKAIDFIIKNKGGICYCNADEEIGMPLPLFGLMTTYNVETASKNYKRVNNEVKRNGCKLDAPFMTLAFMALSVIPHLKITPDSLFDVDKFSPTSIYAGE